MPTLGRSLTFGYAKDSTRNTPTADATKFAKVTGFDVQAKNEYFDDESMFGRREGLMAREIVSQYAEGSLDAYLDVDGILGEMLFHTFGSVGSDTALGATTHTFSTFLNQTELPTFTLQYRKGDVGAKRLKGGAVKSLELDFSDKDCTLKAQFMGLAEEAGDTQTSAITAPTRHLLAKSMTGKYATTVAGLDSGTAMSITKFNAKIDTGAEADKVFGSLNPIDIQAGTVKIEFSFAGLVRDSVWDAANLANTNYAYEFDCNMLGLPVLGSSALRPRLRLRFPPSAVEVTTTIERDGFVAFEAKVMVEYSIADAYNIEIVLQNTQASY